MLAEFTYIRDWNEKLANMGWWHSFELPDGTRIEGVCSLEGLRHRLSQFPIPEDLRGKRVLDVGAWDGFFSFEMAKRGAEVVSIDCWYNKRFRFLNKLLGARIDYRIMDVYDLSPSNVGRFDIVIFFGVLYHLKHPLLALERICALSTDLVAVDSFVVKQTRDLATELARKPSMEFYERDEMGGQTDNWSGPNVACLAAMCRAAGFARVQPLIILDHSACFACYRKWEPPGIGPAPTLLDATHNVNYGLNFSSERDEYVSLVFRYDLTPLTVHDVLPEVGPYGSTPMHVSRRDDGTWQVNFKLPPGLTSGWHDARVRISGSESSNSIPLAVAVPIDCEHLAIEGVQMQKGWVEIWTTPLPANADPNNVQVWLADERISCTYVKGNQVNATLPDDLEGGTYPLRLELGNARSNSVSLIVAD